jgi:hypothetical protein
MNISFKSRLPQPPIGHKVSLVLTFRNLFLSIAGLWILCSIQNQTHPHRYLNYSSTEQSLHAAPAKTVDHAASLNKKIPQTSDHAIVPTPVFRVVPVKQKVFSPISRVEAQPKLYRLFPTGLSPPIFSA